MRSELAASVLVGNEVREEPTFELSVTSALVSTVSNFVPSVAISRPSTVPVTAKLPVTVAPEAVAATLVEPAFCKMFRSLATALIKTTAFPARLMALSEFELSCTVLVRVVPEAVYVPVPISKLVVSSMTYCTTSPLLTPASAKL
jgi:hypothetical protein